MVVDTGLGGQPGFQDAGRSAHATGSQHQTGGLHQIEISTPSPCFFFL
jgi:hypothetical protein